MPLLMKHTGPLWGIWKIEEPSEVLFALLQNRKEYLPQLELIRTEQRRREWLASRVLLQELTGGSALIAYHPNGAPYLSGSSLHISISHTKGYAAVLLQDHPAAGIDIEYRSERVSRIRSRFMIPKKRRVSTRSTRRNICCSIGVRKRLFLKWSVMKRSISFAICMSVRSRMRRKGVLPSMKPVRKKGRFIGWTTLSPPISY